MTQKPDTPITNDPAEALRLVKRLRDQGALFAVSHSGGKDSQAMLITVRKIVPANQIVVFHAELGEVEWPGTLEHAKETSKGLTFRVCRAEKTLFDMVRHRRMWPSALIRQCTSDLKRGPIEAATRAYADEHGFKTIVETWGLRAAESDRRAKQTILVRSNEKSTAGRDWYVWLPIHRMSTDEVWRTIHGAGQKGHWAYDKGMSRLSCSFCIMSKKKDLGIAALERPDLFRKYEELEREVGHTIFVRKRKGEVVRVPIREHLTTGRIRLPLPAAAPTNPRPRTRGSEPVVTADDLMPEKPKRKLPLIGAPPKAEKHGILTADDIVKAALKKYGL